MASVLIWAAAQAAQAPVSRPNSMQQDFDAASQAVEAGDCAKAISMFENLERSGKVRPGSLAAGAIAVRKGQCLLPTGRVDESEKAITSGLPILEKAGPDFANDVSNGHRSLGDIALRRWNYADAQAYYRKALAPLAGIARLMPLLRLAQVSAFDEGPEPLAYAEEALQIATAQPDPPKSTLAAIHTLHARILQNRGQTQAAFDELKQALSLSGGLTSRTTVDEASMRGDLGLAAMLLGRKDDARRYLAWTGAGRISESPFATATRMFPPECGEETGLRPEDFAVVEFGIEPTGEVGLSQTIYTRGGPKVAAAFAQAVSQWSWHPEAIAKIPNFYRMTTRVELRCSNASGQTPSLLSPLTKRFIEWAGPKVPLGPESSQSQFNTANHLKQRLGEFERSADIAGQVATIGMLALSDPRTNAETVVQLAHGIELGVRDNIPVESVNALRVLRLLASPYAQVKGSKYQISALKSAEVLALANDPAIAADALAQNTLRLIAGMPALTRQQSVRTMAEVQLVADDNRLAEHHPLRQIALVKLANVAADSGDLAGAQAYFARTGLTEQQCALIGASPALRRAGAGSEDFPQEAMQYGFEGWVSLEFDIAADGKAIGARPVIAYPPFVFVEGATRMARGLRYESSFRPSGGLACNARRETIKFMIPKF